MGEVNGLLTIRYHAFRSLGLPATLAYEFALDSLKLAPATFAGSIAALERRLGHYFQGDA